MFMEGWLQAEVKTVVPLWELQDSMCSTQISWLVAFYLVTIVFTSPIPHVAVQLVYFFSVPL